MQTRSNKKKEIQIKIKCNDLSSVLAFTLILISSLCKHLNTNRFFCVCPGLTVCPVQFSSVWFYPRWRNILLLVCETLASIEKACRTTFLPEIRIRSRQLRHKLKMMKVEGRRIQYTWQWRYRWSRRWRSSHGRPKPPMFRNIKNIFGDVMFAFHCSINILHGLAIVCGVAF